MILDFVLVKHDQMNIYYILCVYSMDRGSAIYFTCFMMIYHARLVNYVFLFMSHEIHGLFWIQHIFYDHAMHVVSIHGV
jgi:hypothetical protein